MKGKESKAPKFSSTSEKDLNAASYRTKSPGNLSMEHLAPISRTASSPGSSCNLSVGSIINSRRKIPNQVHNSPFKKKIVGDIFGSSMTGDSMLGMLYRSRIEANLDNADIAQDHDEKSEEASLNILSNNDSIADDSSDSDDDFNEELNPRQRLALTIQNWSKTEDNDSYLLKEGAVHAIVALAGADDHRIKMCCATTLYNLSARPENRPELLAVGGATGIIAITKTVQQWKMAKLCALTLRNLSFFEGGEDTMAKEGAMFAIKCLLSIRNQRLAPTCVQTLYNMTCVDAHFKEMERIIKALLTLPQLSTFDATPYIVKSLVNCSRFTPLRVRIVEDGALQTFTAFIQSLHHRDVNRHELVFYMATCIRQLSDSQVCRLDMISKGCVELIYQLLPYSDDDSSKLLLIKSIHNLLSVVQSFPMIIFEISVNIIIDMVFNSKNDIILQYASSCLYTFTTQEMMKGVHRLTSRLIKALPKLLLARDTVTQYFSVATSANMFFEDLSEDKAGLEGLLRKFVEAGDHIDDVTAVRAMVVTIARLCENAKYMIMIAEGGLLDKLLDILLITVNAKDASFILVREACCVSICLIALRKEKLTPEVSNQVANVLKSMLHIDTKLSALENTVSGIRALLEQGICHNELLSDELIDKIAQIAIKYKTETELCRLCCSVLAVLSFDQASNLSLSSDRVLGVLFAITRCDDAVTREFVATCICNISINIDSSKKLIRCGVIDIIASLSGATSERIQDLCAKCICNLTCVIDLHADMIKNKILQTILMISLVRSVNELTRRLCARALLNMLSSDNVKAMLEAGVIRAFANLSLINEVQTHHICARAFLIFTLSEKGREEICSRRPVLHALLGLVKGEYMKTKIIIGKAVCNILSCAANRKAAILGGTLSVLKIIATFDVEDLRERIAKVLIVMAREPTLYDYLLREQVVPVLVLILKESSAMAFQCSVFALSCLSETDKFRDLLVSRGCVTSIVNAILNGKVNSVRVAEEICRCFCYISFAPHEAETVLTTGNMLLALHAIYRRTLCSKHAAELIALIIRNLTDSSHVCPLVVEQDSVKLIRSLMDEFGENSPALCKAAVFVLSNLGKDCNLHKTIIEHGMLTILHQVAEHVNQDRSECDDELDDEDSLLHYHYDGNGEVLQKSISNPGFVQSSRKNSQSNTDTFPSVLSHKPFLSHDTILNVIFAIEHISNSTECRMDIVEGGAVSVFGHLFDYVDEGGKYQMACSLAHLASAKECRSKLVEQQTEALLIALSKTNHVQTRTQCSTALGYLSEFTKVHAKTVSSLLYSAYKTEDFGIGPSPLMTNDREQEEEEVEQGKIATSFSVQSRSLSGKDLSINTGPIPGVGRARVRGSLFRRMEEHEKQEGSLEQSAFSINKGRSPARQKEKLHGHGVNVVLAPVDEGNDMLDSESIGSVETLQGVMNESHDPHADFEYEIANHTTNQEFGGMAKQLKVDLPNPSLSKANILISAEDRRSQVVADIPIVMTTIPKDNTAFDLDGVRQSTAESPSGNDGSAHDDDDHRLKSSDDGRRPNSKEVKRMSSSKKSMPNLIGHSNAHSHSNAHLVKKTSGIRVRKLSATIEFKPELQDNR